METTKEIIIEKAYHLFLSRGFDAVSVNDICVATGLSKGALYHHFANKNELFKAVVDSYVCMGKERLMRDFASLKEYIEFKIQGATILAEKVTEMNYLPLNYISLLIDAMRNYPEIQDVKDHIFHSELEDLKEVLQNSINQGEIRKDLNVESTAQNLLTISFGIAANLIRTNSRKLSIDAYANQLRNYYTLLQTPVLQ